MEVYIDGACKNNGKSTAKASFGIFWNSSSNKNINGLVPDCYKQTNNTGELFAAVQCLKQIHELKLVTVSIKSDSEYLVRGVTNDIVFWKNNNWKLKSTGNDVKNKELWSEIDRLSTDLAISWIHVARDTETGQIEADKLAKSALSHKPAVSVEPTIQSASNDLEWTDDDDETIPLKLVTPRRNSRGKQRNVTKNNSPSLGVMSALKRIESLLLSTVEDVSNINDVLNCHIDETNRQFQEIHDKFTSLANTVKTQNSSTLSAVEEVYTQTQAIKSEVQENRKTFVNKGNSLWDKVNNICSEVKSIKSTQEKVQPNNANDSSPMVKKKESSPTTIKQTPGTYRNAVKKGLPEETIQLNTPIKRNQDQIRPARKESRVASSKMEFNTPPNENIFPNFRNDDGMKNVFVVGSSTLKKLSPRKMSTENVNTKVKTIRGGRIRDIEDCLIQYISEGRLNNVDVIAVHVGTNNVSDRDSIHAIMEDYRNIISTVRQSLPYTKLIISSILPRPSNQSANKMIAEVNNQLQMLKEPMVEILDNTLDFLYNNSPDQDLFADHVHTNTAGAKVLSHNIMSVASKMLHLPNTNVHFQPNFHSERLTGRRFSRLERTIQRQQFQNYWK